MMQRQSSTSSGEHIVTFASHTETMKELMKYGYWSNSFNNNDKDEVGTDMICLMCVCVCGWTVIIVLGFSVS